MAPDGRGGFGNKLVVRSLAQVGGTIEREWQPDGVVITMRIKKDSLLT